MSKVKYVILKRTGEKVLKEDFFLREILLW